ncbi:hypothetical protein L6164_013098 [Bauhinia variegata]|uniref:Uncharacterized protein n=1 Tax=Bauhinia variegata TaxID=167791 RepID=A0ACB9PBA7_BAUVA|nr:hypothetical protein L6164_013098 [Bauhinia variegata]
MATSLNLTSSEQFRLVSLNVPDDGIKGQVQQSHKRTGYSKLLRQPHLVIIQKIMKPATFFVDSMLLMEEIAIKAGERPDEINIHHLSMKGLDKFESGISLDAKAVKLNSVIKITLEVTENICALSLLSDIEHNENLLSMSVYWAILSVVACYIQIDLLKELGQVALDISYLVSNLSNMLIVLTYQKTICKPQLGHWYIKGLWFSGGQPSGVLVDPKSAIANPFAESGATDKFYIHHQQRFPFKNLAMRLDGYGKAQPASLPLPFKHYTDVNNNKKEGDKQIEPPNGFQGLLQKKKRGDK